MSAFLVSSLAPCGSAQRRHWRCGTTTANAIVIVISWPSYAHCATSSNPRLLLFYVLFFICDLHSEEALASVYLLYHVPLLLHASLSAVALASDYMHTLACCIAQLYKAIFSRSNHARLSACAFIRTERHARSLIERRIRKGSRLIEPG